MTERATPFDSLKPLAGRTLEAALNRALSLDPEIRDGLRALDGRSVALQVAAPAMPLKPSRAAMIAMTKKTTA
jgi:ubiquinone biosynthesis protein UbiJ